MHCPHLICCRTCRWRGQFTWWRGQAPACSPEQPWAFTFFTGVSLLTGELAPTLLLAHSYCPLRESPASLPSKQSLRKNRDLMEGALRASSSLQVSPASTTHTRTHVHTSTHAHAPTHSQLTGELAICTEADAVK